MKLCFFIFAAILSLRTVTATAGEVVKMGKDKTLILLSDTSLGEDTPTTVCLSTGTCGRVVKRKDYRLVVRFSAAPDLSAGDEVDLTYPSSREPASVKADLRAPTSGEPIASFGGGLQGGPNYLFPTVDVRYASSQYLTLGLRGNLASSETSARKIQMVGGALTASCAFSPGPFHGLGIEASGGMMSFTTVGPNAESALVPTGSAGLFWGLLLGSFHIHTGVGAYYGGDPKFAAIDTPFRGAMPYFRLGIGFVR